jgi:hypothetical protein
MRAGDTSLPEVIQVKGCVGRLRSNDVTFGRIINFGIAPRFGLGTFSILVNI